MKLLRLGLSLCWLALSVKATANANKVPQIELFGTPHVLLEEWAQAGGFQARWVQRQDEIKLTRGATTLVLTHNSRRMEFNGLLVWLNMPMTVHQGRAHISAGDLRSTVEPLLFPARNPKGRRVKTIVLDPGHGGKDPGNHEGSQYEKKYALLLAQELQAVLTRAGFNVSLTRTTDILIDLPERPAIARRRGADLFVSLHYNSIDGPGASTTQGLEVFALTPPRASSTNARGEGAGAGAYTGNRQDAKNILLAQQVQQAVVRRTGITDRGLKRARFAVLRDSEMPAVLIEAGFMTHPAEARRIYDPAYRKRMAQAIADGIVAYKKLVERD